MPLDHTKLDVHHRALDLLDLVDQVHEVMPPGRAHVKDQLDRRKAVSTATIAPAREMLVRVMSMLARRAGA